MADSMERQHFKTQGGVKFVQMANQKLTKKRVLNAIARTGGVLAAVASNLGVARQTVYDFMERNPDVKDQLTQERESIIDMAESKLFKAVQQGDSWAIKTVLSTIGKDRGYTEKKELDIKDNTPAAEPKKMLQIVRKNGC